jgi:hypothetical protein
MPKSGADAVKIKAIRKVLTNKPDGLWVREIARRTRLDKSTVSIYLSRHMSSEIEEIYPIKGKLMKIVRLKK